MSDNNIKLQIHIDAESGGFAKNPTTGCYEKAHTDGLKFVLNERTGPTAGIGYVTLEPDGCNQAALDASLAQWGVEGVVALLLAGCRTAQRNKANNAGLPAELTPEKIVQLATREPIYWKTDDALSWKPGQRDLTVAGYDALIKDAIKIIKDPQTPKERKLEERQNISKWTAARQELIDRQVMAEIGDDE